MPRPIRVLQVLTRLNVGGPARYCAWLMSGLARYGIEQELVVGRVEPGEDDIGPELEAQGLSYTTLPSLARSVSPVRDLAAVWGLLRIMLRFNPHILSTHTAKAGFAGRGALLLYRPLCLLMGRQPPRAVHTFHGHTFHGHFGPTENRIFLILERIMAKLATWRIVVLGPLQLEEIHTRFRVGERRQFFPVEIGLDFTPYGEPAKRRGEFRRRYGVGEKETAIGMVGRIAPIKNQALLLEAAARLKAHRPELYSETRFFIIGGGDGSILASLHARADELGIADRVIFTGNLPGAWTFMPGLDICTITSFNEGTPFAILEAGACGLPVASTEVGEIASLLGKAQGREKDGVTPRERGLTCPPGDPDALAHALARLMDDPAGAKIMGKNLESHVRRAHDLKGHLKILAGLYARGAGCAVPLGKLTNCTGIDT